MIPSKFCDIVMSCLTAIILSVPIAFIMVAMKLGFVPVFLPVLLKSALASVLISIPSTAVGIQIAGKLTEKIIKK